MKSETKNESVLKEFFDKIVSINNIDIKNHPDTCCIDTSFNVVNFDDIKLKFCKELKVGHLLRSVDVVFIENHKKLFLIEMCNFENWKKRTGKSIRDFVNDQLSSNEIKTKIIDSFLILLGLAFLHDSSKKVISHLLDKNQLIIVPILLTNMSKEENLDLHLVGLKEQNFHLTERLGNNIFFYNCGRFFNEQLDRTSSNYQGGI